MFDNKEVATVTVLSLVVLAATCALIYGLAEILHAKSTSMLLPPSNAILADSSVKEPHVES